MALRDKLLSLRGKLRRERADDGIPELAELLGGEALYVRELTGAERDEYEMSRIKTRLDGRGNRQMESDYRNLRARLLVKCLVDERGGLVFGADDIDEVGEWPSSISDKLFETAQRLSGFTKGAEEELEKNLRRAAGAASSSTSPDTSAGAASNGALQGSAASS